MWILRTEFISTCFYRVYITDIEFPHLSSVFLLVTLNHSLFPILLVVYPSGLHNTCLHFPNSAFTLSVTRFS